MPEPDLACFAPRALAATSPAFVEPRTVRFQDVDAAGIVFYPRILEYFHDAYVGFLASVDLPLPRVLAEQTFIAPVRRANAEFLRPMRFGDPIDVGLVCAVFVGSSLTLGYRIAGRKAGHARPQFCNRAGHFHTHGFRCARWRRIFALRLQNEIADFTCCAVST